MVCKNDDANCIVPCTDLKTDVRTVSLKPVLPIIAILRKTVVKNCIVKLQDLPRV